MTNGKNDVEELEELLTELEDQGALPIGSYSEEDDAPTQQMEAPVGDQEWMVQLAPLDRRMMSGEQVRAELASGNSIDRDTLVWRGGMSDWTPIARVDELSSAPRTNGAPPSAALGERRPAPLPPPPVPKPPRVLSSPLGAPLPPIPLPPVPMPPVPPSAAFGLPRPTPPIGLPALHSAFNALPVPASPVSPAPVRQPANNPAFQVPPAAAAPSPAPPVFGASRNNTARPVAVDFGELAPAPPARPMRTLLASGVAAVLTVIVTVYSLSQGGVFESGGGVSAENQASSLRTAAPVQPTSEPAAASPAAASPAATPEPAAPVEPQPQAVEAPAAEAKAESAAPAAESAPPAPAAASAASKRPTSTREPRAASAPVAEKRSENAAPAPPTAAPAPVEPAASTQAEAASKDSAPVRMARMLEARRKARVSAAAGDADATEAAAAPAKPRRSRARASGTEGKAAAATASDVDSAETPKDADKPGSTFDRDAAKIALDGAANQAKNCRPQGGPSGTGRVQVSYEPSGKVGAVSILTPKFDNTTAGSCVMMVFKRASIPAFSGAPSVVLTKNFEIP